MTTEDVAVVSFEAAGGVLGSVVVSQVSPGRKNRIWLEVDGSEAAVAFDQEASERLWVGSRECARESRRLRAPGTGLGPCQQHGRFVATPVWRKTMKAIRISAPVGVEGLVYEDAPDPKPAIGDVLVKVHACGFTASELFWPLYTDRAGRDRTPLIPGHEFSGVVVELGYGTAGLAVGDEVYGLIDGYRDGGAAELIAIEARDVAPAPTTIDHVQAASLAQAGLTSWQALFDHGRLTPGQTVMIHGAAGAVGSIAVQLAKAKGVAVLGTGRTKVRSLVLDLGAAEFVDIEQDGWQDRSEEIDVVFDTIGGDVLAQSVAIVKPGGAVVSIVSPPPVERHDVRTVFFVRHPNGAQLVAIAGLVEGGELRPQVGAVYPLAEARQAFAAKSAGGIAGRVVLQP